MASSISNAISNAISGFIDTVSKTLSGIAKGITDSIAGLLKPLGEAISGFTKSVSDTLNSMAKGIMDSIIGMGKNILDMRDFIINALQNMASQVGAGFQAISTALMGFINGTLRVAEEVKSIGVHLSDLITSLGDLQKAFSKFPEWFKTDLVQPLKDAMKEVFTIQITEHKPAPASPEVKYPALYTPTASVKWALPIFPEIEILSDPFKWFSEKLILPISGWASHLWDSAKSLFDSIMKQITDVFSKIWETITSIAKSISDTIIDKFQKIWSMLVKPKSPELGFYSKSFEEFVYSIYDPVQKMMVNQAQVILIDQLTPILAEFAYPIPKDKVSVELMKLLTFSMIMMFFPIVGQLPVRLASWTFRALARAMSGLEWNIRINLRPLGLGVDTQFNLFKALGATLHETASNLEKWLDEIGRGLVYGYAIWFSRPIAKLGNMIARNFIPVEMPRDEILLESLRRSIPHKTFNEKYKLTNYFLAIHGYSDYVIDLLTAKEDKLSIEVTDRFGTKRKIPLALLYELPSASDVATMMVRDVFASVEDFQKLYQARGMAKDVGALYYFLRFRYPPPEKLWQFTMRGISGLLWATLPEPEKADIRKEIEAMGAIMPTSPVELNFKPDILMTAFKTYMKWHDYFRGAWMQGFTSDNLIYIDTLADIPTKIDMRWMVKWGVYELFSAKGVTYESTVREFATKIIEPNAVSQVQMDLTNFSRTLQATGIHPDWIPATAVAETMNALTEERTALRTGFISLFKEGFYDVASLETLLAGFISTSFKVAYFDITQMKWTTGWVNMPVMYLPPERKLLELRALMDRSLDILRDIQRDISTAYQEFIIWDYNEYKSRLTQVINSINEFYSKDYETITGVKLPDQLKLKFVEDYYKPYVEALKTWRDVFTIRRVRMWTQRWLGWIMYRVAYGTVEKEDVEKLVKYVGEKAKLTDYETEFIKQVMELMYGISKRTAVSEYLPTPSTLATLSEYMTLDVELVKKILVERGLPKEWQDIWLTYITVRPVKSDARNLLSAYIRALRYGVVTRDVVDNYIKTLPKYGFTDREISLIVESVNLEEQIIEARTSRQEYIPTPSMLATICEYIPEARKFFDTVAKARRIPQEWQAIWAKYIDIRPLVDDIKRYLSRAEQLYVRFMIKQDDFKKILNEASNYLGYTPKELEFLMKVTEFERYRNAWTELIGSVERLVSLSEYSPRASKYALGKLYEMINALPLSDDEKKELKAMWEEYIRNRPVKSEARTYITQLINLYVDGLISDDAFKNELQEMKKWGFSDTELMFYEAQASLRRARKLRIPVGE
jgi:chemotaxis regulatin CheY-phosphate phosphatase CheZ